MIDPDYAKFPYVQVGKWQEFLVLKPRKINGNWVWLRKAYRRRVVYIVHGFSTYEYAKSIFDIIREYDERKETTT